MLLMMMVQGIEDEEISFQLEPKAKSNTDMRKVKMGIDKDGGNFRCYNSIGRGVASIGVNEDESGFVRTTDKFSKKFKVLHASK